MPMRSDLVDNYFNQVMKGSNEQNDVFREIYRNVMDNRIFNNLKQQLNEMIEDEKALIQVEEFRKIFFNKLIITLTISDILFLIFNVYESLHLYFVETRYCGVPGYIQYISYPSRKITMCFSIYMTVILTFERFSAVTNPITHRARSIGSSLTKQFLKYISPVLLVSFIVFGAPLFFAFKMEPIYVKLIRTKLKGSVS